MTGTLRWHSCSTNDFPLKRHKVSKACEACRGKKMRCDGKNPCERCKNNKITCTYNDKPVRARSNTIAKPRQRDISSNSPPLAPNETLLPPSPTMETIISTENLHKISSSSNELYETFRSANKKRRQFGTSLPPLLFDFYSSTLHNASVWAWFIESFHRLCNYQQEQPLNVKLVREAVRLFVTHNLLYGAFIHTQLASDNALYLPLLSNKKRSSLQQTSPTHSPKPAPNQKSDVYDSILIHIILALTLQTAYQTLVNDALADHLSSYAHIYYRQAHQQFMEACFPSESIEHFSFTEKKNLVQASILIAHFQCQVIDEEQAYMTIRLGISLAQRFSLDEINADMDEDDSLSVSLKVLDAWYIWLTFYLDKPYSPNELMTSHHEGDSQCFTKTSKNHQWALQVTGAYTLLFKSILKRKKSSQNISLSSVKESLRSIYDTLPPLKQTLDNNHSVISLFNNVFIIQLLSSQLDYPLQNQNDVDSTFSVSSHSTDTPATQSKIDNDIHHHLPKENITMTQMCIQSSQTILTAITRLVQQGNLTAQYVIYATCLISQQVLFFERNKKVLSQIEQAMLHNNNKQSTSTTEILCVQLIKLMKKHAKSHRAFDFLLGQLNWESGKTTSSATGPFNKSQVPPSPSPSSSSSEIAMISTIAPTSTAAPTTVESEADVTMATTPAANMSMTHFLTNTNDVSTSAIIPQDLLLSESNVSIKSTLEHIVSVAHPSVYRDIDREQLDKLSHKLPASRQQQQQQQQHEQQQLQQYQQYEQQQFFLQQHKYQQQQQHSFNQFHFQQALPNSINASNYLFTRGASVTGGPTIAAAVCQKRNRSVAGLSSQQRQLMPNTMTSNSNSANVTSSITDQQYYYYHNSHKNQQQIQYSSYPSFSYNNSNNNNGNSSNTHHSYKRLRSDTTVPSYEEGPLHNSTVARDEYSPQTASMINEDDIPQQRSRHTSIATAAEFINVDDLPTDSHPANDAELMYLVLDGNEAPFYSNTQNQHPSSDPFSRDKSSDVFSSQGSLGQENENSLTKLPLPQPSKATSMPPKSWFAPPPAQSWNRLFSASEIQTLHSSNFPLGLNVIQEAQPAHDQTSPTQLLYPHQQHHRASIISDKSSISSQSSLIQQSRQQTDDTTTTTPITRTIRATTEAAAVADEVAAAAVAAWPSSAAAAALANGVSFPQQRKSRRDTKPITKNQRSSSHRNSIISNSSSTTSSAPGHWINSEKVVGDEEDCW